MSEIILPKDFRDLVFDSFMRSDRENDPDAAIAMQSFLKRAKQNQRSFEKAQTDIANDVVVAAFIEEARLHRLEQEDEKIKADLHQGIIEKIDGSTALLVEILQDVRKENAELRQEVKGINKRLDESEKKDKKRFPFTLLAWVATVASFAFSVSPHVSSWLGPKKDCTQPEQAVLPEKVVEQKLEPLKTEDIIPRDTDAAPPPTDVIPLQDHKLLGPYDPFTGCRMVDLLEQGKKCSWQGQLIFMQPSCPVPPRKLVRPPQLDM
ncbi:MAG: hypothetical protein FWF24_01800 [Alphaproteobacteria bacterium]|nr:hypothetical protein [Alphaproteobacteria bacterium]